MKTLVFFISIGLSISCSSKKSNNDASADNTSTTASNYSGTSTINDFDGQATSEQLTILLNNSELSCTSGDIISFNGESWTCTSKFENFRSTGITDDATSESMTIDANGNVGIASSSRFCVGTNCIVDNSSYTFSDFDVNRDGFVNHVDFGLFSSANGCGSGSGCWNTAIGVDQNNNPIFASNFDFDSNNSVDFGDFSLLGAAMQNYSIHALTATTAGNVGIGTTAPERKLHISDAMRLEPIASPPASPSNGDIYYDDSDAVCMYVNGGWRVIEDGGSGGACS